MVQHTYYPTMPFLHILKYLIFLFQTFHREIIETPKMRTSQLKSDQNLFMPNFTTKNTDDQVGQNWFYGFYQLSQKIFLKNFSKSFKGISNIFRNFLQFFNVPYSHAQNSKKTPL